ncbi:MAG: hypothetical protein IT427_00085 [Pirellulales bacterium]|nr:hypothetical protein [Pirellulales bacterium]
MNEAIRRVAESREYLAYWMAVEFDRLKLRFRRLLIWAAIGFAILMVFVAILISAAAMLLWGLADWIGAAFGGRTWIGALVVGGGILLLATAGFSGGVWGWNRTRFQAAKRRYEARKRRQREQFGRSIDREDRQAS